MTLEDFMNDPEADAELRAGTKRRPKVTQEEHKRYVQDRLLEACGKLDLESIEKQYQRAVSAIRELTVVPQAQDISDFCTRNVVLRPRILGIFASALVNTVQGLEEPIFLEITRGVSLDYLGYRLNRKVHVKGDLGDHTAYMMESGPLTIDGSCKGVVGEFMGKDYGKEPFIDVRGTIRDVGAVRYGGTIRANRNLSDYYNFQNIYDLLRVIVEANIFQEVAAAIKQGGAIPLQREMKRILHPKLVAIAGNHNLQLYERERNPIVRDFADIEKQYIELVSQWNVMRPQYEKAKKDAIGTGIINGAALLTPFAPLVMMFGLFTLFTGIDTLTLGGKLKALQPRITALQSLMNQYEGTIRSYDAKISEVRVFMG